ncbi:OLC1v1037718C1 [Oldenlandia corymbosa var. corymbosa]|uniref:OLC1v1037718C1 n=1 Tax=Oldenlandia corymbosa var. corymbosa TaxID=529605 RepID=A0AAV1CY87_OLDCO|nr:OLC1v1037718C1 [Oldenlandia corymbosa var. corymbosa]
MAPPRILLSGDVLGRFNQLCKRVSSVNKSAGPFDAVLCVGQFFPDSPEALEEVNDYIEGRSKFPIPTYFIGDYGIGAPKILSAVSKEAGNLGFKMDGLKVCGNLFWLKGSGKFTLHGLSIVYLSGRQSANNAQFGTYSQDDVDALRALAEEPGIVDIFLTYPFNYSAGADSTISELVAEIKPRYHIAGTMGVFYDREPYTNLDVVHVTRFMGLAPVGNKEKQKFIHAISPTPASLMSSSEISARPPKTTISPYTLMEKVTHTEANAKRAGESVDDPQYWRYDVSQKRQRHGEGDGEKLCFKYTSSGSCPRGDNCRFRHDDDARQQSKTGVCFEFLNKGRCERGSECTYKHSLVEVKNSGTSRSKECWFCLSSPNVESHLITSIGELYYCALAKGPLVEDHVLIIPVEHVANTLSTADEYETELHRLQNSLKAYFKTQGKEVVFFEWVFKRGTHANLQVVPVPSTRASSIRDIFHLAAKKLGFKFNTIEGGRRLLRALFDRSSSLFYVELPDGVILTHVVEENEKFPSQFGREVMAGLLNMADRADWKNCKLSKEEETTMAESFKKKFEPYDPYL